MDGLIIPLAWQIACVIPASEILWVIAREMAWVMARMIAHFDSVDESCMRQSSVVRFPLEAS